MTGTRAWILLALIALGSAGTARAEETTHDVVIYGGTSSAVIAAVQVRRMGRTVAIVCPDTHLGGLSAGGLGWTDSGDKTVTGGVAREFYRRVKAHYDRPEAWTWQASTQDGRYRQDDDAMWVFEPHVAEAVFERMVEEAAIPVFRDHWLERSERAGANGVEKDGSRIVAITMTNGRTFRGRVFIDATYEGDLMAAAGVSYTVGREPNRKYGETLAGVQKANARSHQFSARIDPYVTPGDPSSGLLPRIHDGDPGADGEGDHRVQAYNYRVCLTRVPQNRVPFPRPDGYDPAQYELLLRTLQAGSKHVFGKFDPVPNAKTDTNNHGSFSTDNIGFNYDYPEASYARRAEILAEHEVYQRGYFFFLASDPRVPEDVRTRMAAWGLAKDEFTDNDHWPHQIYVREARRMVSDFVMTEGHLRGERPTPRPVGMGSYNMDSHHVQRYVAHDDDGRAYVRNEGDIQVSPGGAYAIAYDALVPKRAECTNLLVPVCLSCSHIAYGSIRMEPVFMILGQSAATAAVMAIDAGTAVQDVDDAALSARLRADGQVLAKLLPVRVMAYNIKHGRGMDGRVDLERIARVIEAVGPDVVTLQEVDERCGRSGDVDQAAWLGARLGMTAIFGPFMDYDGGRYGMALLSKWPIVAWENHALPPGPEPRTVLAARLRVVRGVEVVVTGVHLYGDGGQRMAQAEAVLRIFETEPRPVILAGDFNSRPASPVMALFGSAWTNPDKGTDRLTFDSVSPDREIDYILLRPGARFEATTVDVLDEPVASDHRPLVIETELTGR